MTQGELSTLWFKKYRKSMADIRATSADIFVKIVLSKKETDYFQ
jgi:hypothetical protein